MSPCILTLLWISGSTLLKQATIAKTVVSQHMKKQALAPDSTLQTPGGMSVQA